jgi:hypothetical protein
MVFRDPRVAVLCHDKPLWPQSHYGISNFLSRGEAEIRALTHRLCTQIGQFMCRQALCTQIEWTHSAKG